MSETAEVFWMVWRENSHAPTYRHFSKQSAVDEAERLARECAGQTFFVLKTTAAMRAELPAVSRIEIVPREDDIPF